MTVCGVFLGIIMGDGRSSGAGLVLCLTILGFAVCLLFALWPLAFIILFLGLVTFCALESSRKGTVPRTPQDTRPRRYEVRTPPTPTTEEYRRPYFRETPEKPQVKVPVKYDEEVTAYDRAIERAPEAETVDLSRKGVYRWGELEKAETSTLSETALRGEPPYGGAEEESDLYGLKEKLESTKAKYRSMSYGTEAAEKAKKEVKMPSVPEKTQEQEDLESQEEANRILLEELKKRWMSGKIDVAMYNKLKEKYEKKIAEIEKQKKKIAKNSSTQASTK